MEKILEKLIEQVNSKWQCTCESHAIMSMQQDVMSVAGGTVHPRRRHAVSAKFSGHQGTLFSFGHSLDLRSRRHFQLTTAFTREVASSYLAEALGGIIESLIEGPKLELDPSKFPVNGMDPEQQARLLGEKCDQVWQRFSACVWHSNCDAFAQIIQSLITSIDRVPQSIRRLVAVFQRSVEVSFPKSKYIVSTGYLFLRVIVPFITSPDGFGLYHRPIEQSGRRNLLLVGKVLQNLANETNFGAKEVYMVVMNPFMGSALKLLQKYIFDLGQISSTPQKSPIADDRSTIEDQMRLHHMLLKVHIYSAYTILS